MKVLRSMVSDLMYIKEEAKWTPVLAVCGIIMWAFISTYGGVR